LSALDRSICEEREKALDKSPGGNLESAAQWRRYVGVNDPPGRLYLPLAGEHPGHGVPSFAPQECQTITALPGACSR